MQSVRERASPLLTAVLATNIIINMIADAIYAETVRRTLRAIARFG